MRDEFRNSENWYYRNLPHYDASNKLQFITYRLADSLPQRVLLNIKDYCSNELTSEPIKAQKYKAIVEKYLDSGYGSCLLSKKENAELVIQNWKHFHEVRYDLIAYVVMPNHVHILIKTYEGYSLSKIVHSWKSYTSHKL